MKPSRAVGVEVERDGQIQRIGARRELIISGGAINSPVLLLASGIGPAAEQTKLGIDVKHDLPGVGKNLQDHYQSSFTFKTNATDTLNKAVMSPAKSVRLALEWFFKGSGQLSIGATEATLFAKSGPSEPVPDIQYQCMNFSMADSRPACIAGRGLLSSSASAGRRVAARLRYATPRDARRRGSRPIT